MTYRDGSVWLGDADTNEPNSPPEGDEEGELQEEQVEEGEANAEGEPDDAEEEVQFVQLANQYTFFCHLQRNRTEG